VTRRPEAPPSSARTAKAYDRAYFDRWYRDPRRKVGTEAELSRQAALVVAAAEVVMGRPVRTVLDVGCGEAPWANALRRIRPTARYLGIDPSPYVVSRYGRSRRIVLGSFGSLCTLNLPGPYDVVVCADVLHYVPDAELRRGLPELARLTGGIAYLEVRAADDDFTGDKKGWIARTAKRYRALFGREGFAPCGLHLWMGPEAAASASALERG
jgi:SAM-dependent methyltransferase